MIEDRRRQKLKGSNFLLKINTKIRWKIFMIEGSDLEKSCIRKPFFQ